MDERSDFHRRALTIALGLMREDETEELASTPRELWTEELAQRHETLLSVAARIFVLLKLAHERRSMEAPRTHAFGSALRKLIEYCSRRDVLEPSASEIAWLAERYVTPGAFHQSIVVEQMFDDLIELRRAREM